jgi:hypothetical protein
MSSAQESLLDHDNKERKLSKGQWGCIVFIVLINIAIAISYGLVITEIDTRIVDASKVCSSSDPGADNFKHPSSQEVNNYFYNIMNPLDIVNGSQAILHEIGPFAYKFKNHRGNVKYDQKENTVTSNDWFVNSTIIN